MLMEYFVLMPKKHVQVQKLHLFLRQLIIEDWAKIIFNDILNITKKRIVRIMLYLFIVSFFYIFSARWSNSNYKTSLFWWNNWWSISHQNQRYSIYKNNDWTTHQTSIRSYSNITL